MKTFDEIRLQGTQLNEVRILRVASAVGLASKVKSQRQKVEQGQRNLETVLKRIQKDKTVEDNLEYITESITLLSEQMSNVSKQISSLTGIGVTTLLTNERSNKQILKLVK